MAKKTVSGSKTEPKTAAPADAATAAKPRARAKKIASDIATPDTAVAHDAVEATSVSPATSQASVSMASEPSEDDIRLRAYHRYLERGGGHGMDFEDWVQARQDLIEKK
jgi:hypothetical protein